ncbi:MAG: CHAT domain-containing protein [Chloroflexi bacterium]|nr:CHAT domain-containing protein [Chloroflexota bacterium]
MTDYADLELGLHRYETGAYVVELRFSQPGSDTDTRLGQSEQIHVNIDPAALNALLPAEYGQGLNEALFADANLKTAFIQAITGSQAQGAALRLRLLIGPSAPELHAIHWETLHNPQDNSPLTTNQNIVFSRYMASMDWRPVSLQSRGTLDALAVVANPSDLANYKLAAIDSDAELSLARDGLQNISVNTCKGSLEALITSLQAQPVDVLYLVCHGYIVNGQPFLCLEDDQGKMAKVPGSELVVRLKELPEQPRLVVLVSCQSAGTGSGEALTSIAPRLAEIGIPAVLAMQANFSMATAQKFLPAFFTALNQDGQIDRAVSVARGMVRDAPDFWVPVLFMRLKSGRLWYTPGFGDARKGATKLPAVIRNIKRGHCTPLIGPGLVQPLLGSMHEIAARWAEKYHYPMLPSERESLPQVAQYLTVHQDAHFPFEELEDTLIDHLRQRFSASLPEKLRQGTVRLNDLLDELGALNRANDPLDPHKALAELPLPIYITANQDNLLESALKAAGREPRAFLCPWNEHVEKDQGEYTDDPTPEKPLVFHLFGCWDNPESIVLTEDNYFDFLIGVTSNKDIIPEQVRVALSDSGLLFLGFQTEEWDFRVLYRSILAQPGSERRSQYAQVAAQVEPEDGRILEPQGARTYLEDYFGKSSDIDIFWGSPQEFLAELMQSWRNGDKP